MTTPTVTTPTVTTPTVTTPTTITPGGPGSAVQIPAPAGLHCGHAAGEVIGVVDAVGAMWGACRAAGSPARWGCPSAALATPTAAVQVCGVGAASPGVRLAPSRTTGHDKTRQPDANAPTARRRPPATATGPHSQAPSRLLTVRARPPEILIQ